MHYTQNEQDIFFMKYALREAQKASSIQEVPIGAIIIDENNKIIGRGYNLTERRSCQIAHAEMNAIKKATRYKGDWRLLGCTMYVTLEPCMMCMGLLLLSRIDTVVYGASSPLFGHHLDKNNQIPLYKEGAIEVRKGILQNEIILVLKQFFKRKRK